MGDGTWRSIFSAGDETVAALDQLHATTQATRSLLRERLEVIVSGLNGSFPDEDEPVPSRRRTADEDRRGTPPDPAPFVALPARTTHGGYWGPQMRDKLTREALAKRRW